MLERQTRLDGRVTSRSDRHARSVAAFAVRRERGFGPACRGHDGGMRAFRDRVDAGRRLAAELGHLRGRDLVVLGLPRGGVPVAAEVAAALSAPLDVIVVRKLGHPHHPEYAVGALGEEGAQVLTPAARSLEPRDLLRVTAKESAELDRRVRVLRGTRPAEPLRGRTAVIVDDGIATGATAAAACQVARHRGAAAVVLAAPVGAKDAIADLEQLADEVVVVLAPSDFTAVGAWYDDFTPTSETEVAALLALS
jgi:putative phosphoribosyl transferase